MASYIKDALTAQQSGTALPFATIDRATNKAIGSTRYMNIDRPNKHVEIGSTWIARAFQRSPVNTEAKLLMLQHAFETLGCMRVELKTDSMNRRSRNAIQRIGARQEGIFRNHMTTYTGRIRHSVYFSILDSEWPQVKSESGIETDAPRNRPETHTHAKRAADRRPCTASFKRPNPRRHPQDARRQRSSSLRRP